MNLTRLRCFLVVAEELNFGRAAQRLNISQPPLTRHIQMLEAEYGCTLLRRNNRVVELTAAGRVLMEEARRLLSQAARVDQLMQKGGQERNTLFFGVVPFALHTVFPEFIRNHKETYPDTQFVLDEGHTSSVIAGVKAGRYDFGIAWRSLSQVEYGNSGLDEVILRRGRFVLALPQGHPLIDTECVTLELLAGEPLILPSRRQSPFYYDKLIAAFAGRGVSPTISREVARIHSQLGYVASGLGIALVPEAASAVNERHVTLRRVEELDVEWQIQLVWSRDRTCRLSPELIDFLRQEYIEGR
ncbi:LysR substrate-binding domain-containing protein [Rhodobacteraceae bacterium DSL-40]|uniref:LysR substrate-binding domain-containing protein n=1 Tax=Amaricoccus sp. B4 TaxID=3368557 RepID=UPI000DAB416C